MRGLPPYVQQQVVDAYTDLYVRFGGRTIYVIEGLTASGIIELRNSVCR